MSNPQSIAFAVANVNTDRRLDQPLYSGFKDQFGTKSRIPAILDFILRNVENGPVFLCELDNYLVEELAKFFASKDLHTKSVRYNMDPSSSWYFIISKTPFSLNHIPLTADGNWGFVENSSFDKKAWALGENFHKSFVHVSLDGIPVDFVFCHVGLTMPARILQCKKIAAYVTENKLENPVVLGDFNMFDTIKGGIYREQAEIFLELGLKNMIEFDTSTFKAYPYDTFFKMNPEDQKTYQVITKDPATTPEQFKQFIDEANTRLVETLPVALDNVFCQQPLTYKTEDLKSDHDGFVVSLSLV